MINQGIHGRHIKLYTGAGIGRNCFIYDDSVPSDAISVNGRHQAIVLIINELEIIFDNHHPNGIPKNQWMDNLQFYGKIHNGCQFKVTEEDF